MWPILSSAFKVGALFLVNVSRKELDSVRTSVPKYLPVLDPLQTRSITQTVTRVPEFLAKTGNETHDMTNLANSDSVSRI